MTTLPNKTPDAGKPLWRLSEILTALGATGGPPEIAEKHILRIDHVVEECEPGSLFVARRASRNDSLKQAIQAFRNGAVAAVISNEVIEKEGSAAAPYADRLYTVENLQVAVKAAAHIARDRLTGQIIAVTGSVGKSSTTALLAKALEGYGTTFKTPGNNNLRSNYHALTVHPQVDYLAMEMSIGVITLAERSLVLRPHVGIVTNIGAAHMRRHKNKKSLQMAKLGVLEGLVPGGTAILDADSIDYDQETLTYLAKHVTGPVLHVGTSKDCEIRIGKITSDHASVRSQIRVLGRKFDVKIDHPAEHNIKNAAFVLASLHAMGLDPEPALEALRRFPAPERRMERHRVVRSDGTEFELLDDAYNASPDSIRSVLDYMARRRQPTRRILVLGDVLELGDHGPDIHAGLIPDINASGADVVITIGPLTRAIAAQLTAPRVMSFDTIEDALSPLNALVMAGDLVVLKGSHGINLEQVVSHWRNAARMLPAGFWQAGTSENEDPETSSRDKNARLTFHDMMGALDLIPHPRFRDTVIERAEFNFRLCGPGILFLGHPRFTSPRNMIRAATRALKNGAEAAIIHADALEFLPANEELADKCYVVGNLDHAARTLANATRRNLTVPIVAVTGSIGKSSIKGLLTTALGSFGPTYQTPANQNLPTFHQVTSLSDNAYDYAVLEMAGSSGRGINFEKRPLHRKYPNMPMRDKAVVVRPRVAIVSNIGVSHLELFEGDPGKVQSTKLSLLEGLVPGGAAILDADSITYDNKTRAYISKHVSGPVYHVGASAKCNVRISKVSGDHASVRGQIEILDRSFDIRIDHPARHNIKNAAFTLAALHALGLDPAQALKSLRNFSAPPRRMERHRVTRPDGTEFELLDDAYNASPDSIRSVLEYMTRRTQAGRRILILGDVLELGDQGPDIHAGLIPDINACGADVVMTVGPLMQGIASQLTAQKVQSFQTAKEACKALDAMVGAGDLVVLKASNGIELEKLVTHFRKHARLSPAGAWQAGDLVAPAEQPIACYVVDAQGRELIAENADLPIRPASLTKLMTLWLTFNRLAPEQMVTVPDHAVVRPGRDGRIRQHHMSLSAGEKVAVMDLILGAIIPSANDAANTLGAAMVPGKPDGFVALMNETAAEMGLSNTRFSTASGMGDGISTARDMGLLARRLHEDFPIWRSLFSLGSFAFRGVRHRNTNQLLFKVDGMTGLKTGTLVPGTYNLITRVTRHDQTLFTIVMGAPTRSLRNSETRTLIKTADETIRKTS